jgi:hypothetical protein
MQPSQPATTPQTKEKRKRPTVTFYLSFPNDAASGGGEKDKNNKSNGEKTNNVRTKNTNTKKKKKKNNGSRRNNKSTKLFQCLQCPTPKTYAGASGLWYHMKNVHGAATKTKKNKTKKTTKKKKRKRKNSKNMKAQEKKENEMVPASGNSIDMSSVNNTKRMKVVSTSSPCNSSNNNTASSTTLLTLNGCDVDPTALLTIVRELGGFDHVHQYQKWKDVQQKLGLPPFSSSFSSSSSSSSPSSSSSSSGGPASSMQLDKVYTSYFHSTYGCRMNGTPPLDSDIWVEYEMNSNEFKQKAIATQTTKKKYPGRVVAVNGFAFQVHYGDHDTKIHTPSKNNWVSWGYYTAPLVSLNET